MSVARVEGNAHGRLRAILDALQTPGALPSLWTLRAWEAEQGISLRFERLGAMLEIDLERLDPARPAYAATRTFNVYYSVFGRARADLEPHERDLVDVVVATVRAHERALPLFADAPPETLATHGAREKRVALREVTAERALIAEAPGMYYLNPYTGCILGCTYCYGIGRTSFVRDLDELPRAPWGRWIDVKVNAPELVAREVRTLAPGTVRMSPLVTDPYQPVERRYRITRRCLEALRESDFTPVVLTRSPVVTDDIALFRTMPRLLIGMSVPTDDDAVRAVFEPNAPPIADRVAALAALRAAGLRTFAVAHPMLPMDPTRLVELLSPLVEVVRVGPMAEKPFIAHAYQRAGRLECSTEAWERATFDALREGFARRGVPVNPTFEPWGSFR